MKLSAASDSICNKGSKHEWANGDTVDMPKMRKISNLDISWTKQVDNMINTFLVASNHHLFNESTRSVWFRL
jgi:hypothetical protein